MGTCGALSRLAFSMPAESRVKGSDAGFIEGI